jgi:hypothetical protein
LQIIFILNPQCSQAFAETASSTLAHLKSGQIIDRHPISRSLNALLSMLLLGNFEL